MKNIFLISGLILGILVGGSFALNAQSDEQTSINRKIFIGGFLDFSNQNFTQNIAFRQLSFGQIGNFTLPLLEQTHFFEFNASPYFGKRINPKASLGLLTNFRLQRSKFLSMPENKTQRENSTTVGLGFFYRNDFKVNKKLFFYFQPSFDYSLETVHITEDDVKLPTVLLHTFRASATLGARFSFNDKWSLISNVSALSYSLVILDDQITGINNHRHLIDLNANFSNISFGLERSF